MASAPFESAWPSHPDYAITIEPFPYRARAWLGALLLADSSRCLVLREERHVDRLYFPLPDVRLDLLAETDHHTICPFKGEADYWSAAAGGAPAEDVLWAYRAPLPEVGAIAGHGSFYQERVRIVFDEPWAQARGGVPLSRAFPAWGDEQDLVGLLDIAAIGADRFVAPARPQANSRAVIEGGQLLGQAIVAASKALPGQRVVNAQIMFAKAASWDLPVTIALETCRQGKAFSVVRARIEQEGRLCSVAQLLLDSGAPDEFRLAADMPTVAGPEDSTPLDMGVTGRQLRVVDGAYPTIGAPGTARPDMPVWVRFRDEPEALCLRQALLAQSTTHWLGVAAIQAIPGLDVAGAHTTFSGAPMSVALSFHDEVAVSDWLLYANRATYAGRGLTFGETRIFTREGRLAASFSVQGMMRPFTQEPSRAGIEARHVM